MITDDPNYPYPPANYIATKEYIKNRMMVASKQMSENTHNGQLYEFYKGQFLAFREILYPDTYGKEVEKNG